MLTVHLTPAHSAQIEVLSQFLELKPTEDVLQFRRLFEESRSMQRIAERNRHALQYKMNLNATGGRSRGNTSVAESTRDGARGKDTMVMFVFRSHLLLRQFDHVIFC